MFDLKQYLTNFDGENQDGKMVVFQVAKPNRRAVHNRSRDIVFMLLEITGDLPFSRNRLQEIALNLTDGYYLSRGSVTFGLREAANELNDILVKRNLRDQPHGLPSGCFMTMGVIRDETLYLAHAGLVQSVLVSRGKSELLSDTSASGAGLGFTESITLHFTQAQVAPGSILILFPHTPEGWQDQLSASGPRLTISALHQMVASRFGEDVIAAFLQFQTGMGVISDAMPQKQAAGDEPLPAELPDIKASARHTARPARGHAKPAGVQPSLLDEAASDEQKPTEESAPAEVPEASPEAPEPEIEEPAQEPIVAESTEAEETVKPTLVSRLFSARKNRAEDETEQPEETKEEQSQVSQSAVEEDGPVLERPPKKTLFSRLFAKKAPVSPQADETETPLPDLPAPEQLPTPVVITESLPVVPAVPPKSKAVLSGILQIIKVIIRALESLMSFSGRLFQRMLPGESEATRHNTGSLMWFIAVAIPILISTIAVTVYTNSGKSVQYQEYLAQAQVAALKAQSQTDPALKRAAWEMTIEELDKALGYGNSVEAESLRREAQQALDRLDGVIRLQLQSAILGNFSTTVYITALAANETEVYLLDATQGRILRLYLTGAGYDIDTTFICTPDPAGTVPGKLVDLVVLPPDNKYRAGVMGIDALGNVMYCGEGREPVVEALKPPPDTDGWKGIKSMLLENGVLYVLDTADSAKKYVYTFTGEKSSFTSDPKIYFNGKVPYATDVRDIGVDKAGLFMLHGDGMISRCTFRISEDDFTTCVSPSPYINHRSGQNIEMLTIPDTQFVQLQTSAAPDSSLYLLDAKNRMIYHFSLKLNFQRSLATQMNQSNPQYKREPTAFTISPVRTMFIAYSNQLFYAKLP